jgi:hypothetical protein
MFAQPVFHPLGPTPAAHHLSVVARKTATTIGVPGHAKALNVIRLTHQGHRFRGSYRDARGVIIYGGGITMRITERADETYHITAVSITGPQRVRVTYTMTGAGR